MPVHRFTVEALSPSAWKNGGGVTREIACVPEGAGLDDFQWRVSIAHIAHGGPFSAFPGIDRVITLLAGAGVRLHTADGALDHRLHTPLVPFAFAGERPIEAELLDGPCDDLNVMVRRGGHSAAVKIVRARDVLASSRGGVLLVTDGVWCAQSSAGEPITLAPGTGVRWNEPLHGWTLSPSGGEGALVAVLVQERGPAQT